MKKLTLAILMLLGSFSMASAELGINVGVSGNVGIFHGTGSDTDTTDTAQKYTESAVGAAKYQDIFVEKTLGSIADMNRLPAALFIVDVVKENIAVKEAKRLNIPVFAMVDTNSDPKDIDFVIPSNDDASMSIEVIVGAMTDAINEGLTERKVIRDEEQAARKEKEAASKEKAAAAKAAAAAEKAATAAAVAAADKVEE